MASDVTAPTKIGEIIGKGGIAELYKYTLDPASIAADAQGSHTVDVVGAKAGDLCFMGIETPNKHVIPQGAKVTANNVVTVFLGNNFTATTAMDHGSTVFFLLVWHLSFPPGQAAS